MNFSELSKRFKDDWQRTTGGKKLYRPYFRDDTSDPVPLSDEISDFLEKYGFQNLTYIAQGSSAIILKDLDNDNLVFRIAPTYSADTRALIPQVLQPLHVQLFDDGYLKMEFLPNISIPDEMDDGTFWKLLDEFKQEVHQSGHRVESNDPQFDVGLLQYEDTAKPGTCRLAFIAADASLVPPVTGRGPTCSENYPSLEDQWHIQCKMVEKDERLKTLLKGLPNPLPKTSRYSPSPSA